MQVRPFIPLRTSAAIQFSGMPHKPKPPSMIVAPSGISRMASSALVTTLFMTMQNYLLVNVRNKMLLRSRLVHFFAAAVGAGSQRIQHHLRYIRALKIPFETFYELLAGDFMNTENLLVHFKGFLSNILCSVFDENSGRIAIGNDHVPQYSFHFFLRQNIGGNFVLVGATN